MAIALPFLAAKAIPWKLIGTMAAIGGVMALVFFAYIHYTGLLTKIEVLTANNTVLESAVEVQASTIEAQTLAIEDWKTAQTKLIEAAAELQKAATAARAETRRLNDIFARHDLEALALAKPGLIENRLNAGTNDASRLLECATGAEADNCPGRDSPPS